LCIWAIGQNVIECNGRVRKWQHFDALQRVGGDRTSLTF